MPTEEIKKDDGAPEEPQAPEEPADPKAPSEQPIDYEAMAKAERERAEKLQKELADREFKLREARRSQGETVEEPIVDEDKPLTARELDERLARERQATEKRFQEDRALAIARANTSSEAEAQASFLHWKNRVVPTGNLEDDVMFAIGGINHKRVVAKNNELARALRSRDTVSDDGSGTHRDPQTGSEPRLAPGDAAAYKTAGFEWDGKLRLYKKPINKGKKHVFKDAKTGRSWVA